MTTTEHDCEAETVTCQTCDKTWCDKCNPTPAARCLFEHEHEPEERTCEEAHEQFGEILDTLGLTITATADPRNDYGENGRPRYFVVISRAGHKSISTEYSCGSAVPLHWYRNLPTGDERARGIRTNEGLMSQKEIRDTYCGAIQKCSLFADHIRRSVRARFLPELSDVVGCLFSDASCVDGHTDWIDWAEEFCQTDSADSLREARKSWDTIQTMTKELRAVVGDRFDTLTELAGEL